MYTTVKNLNRKIIPDGVVSSGVEIKEFLSNKTGAVKIYMKTAPAAEAQMKKTNNLANRTIVYTFVVTKFYNLFLFA